MRYEKIPSSLFTDRRAEFAQKMEPGSIAVFFSNDEMPRTGDQFYPYRQDSALFALTGIDQPGTILILYPDGKKKNSREMVFILPIDPLQAIWNGDRLTVTEAKQVSGISSIKFSNEWDTITPELFHAADSIYVNSREQDKFHSPVITQNERKAIELKQLYPVHAFHRAQPILRQMMMIKHPIEIDQIRKAVEVTSEAFRHALHHLKPGMKEFELEAVLTYIFTKHGCRHAFEPIIASGKSACTLHYVQNNNVICEGTLVLLDFGAEYGCITSDMSRTIPASGQFTKEQKNIYNAVLRVLKHTMSWMTTGVKVAELNKEAGKNIEQELVKLKLISRADIRKQDARSPLWKKYFMHGISHHLGYDVHDIADRDSPLKAGMVLTCEPGLYIPELGIGIRLENDVLITRKGPVNLMSLVPIEAEEIENLMQTKT
ncbi:MAG: aminopeptidase P family protein [Saprospiraceae bacterium]